MPSVTSKLRDSCNACAMSKIKCPKERPSCSRCESRNVSCSYSFTKRPGRKPENGSRCQPAGAITATSGGGAGATPGNGNRDASTDNGHDAHGHSVNGDQLANQTTNSNQTARHSPSSLDALFWSESPAACCNSPGINSGTNSNINGLTHTTKPNDVLSPSLQDSVTHVAPADSPDVFSMVDDMHNLHHVLTFPDMELDGFDDKMDEFLESTLESHFGMPTGTADDMNTTSATPTRNLNDIASLLIPLASTSTNMASSEAPSTTGPGSTGSSSIFSWPASSLSTTPTLSLISSSPKLLHMQLVNATDGSSVSSGHLAQTLDILKTLSSTSELTQTALELDSLDNPPDHDAFTKAVLGENHRSIDAVGTILSSSSCSDDGFLLAVMLMTVLKILERYGAAAHAQPVGVCSAWGTGLSNGLITHQDHGRRRTLSPGTPGPRNDDSGRETKVAKLVLGELHRVQRLVNELSRELEKHRERGWSGDPTMRGDGRKPTNMMLVTAGTLEQLETDMRKSLNALSTEIIDRLRKG